MLFRSYTRLGVRYLSTVSWEGVSRRYISGSLQGTTPPRSSASIQVTMKPATYFAMIGILMEAVGALPCEAGLGYCGINLSERGMCSITTLEKGI